MAAGPCNLFFKMLLDLWGLLEAIGTHRQGPHNDLVKGWKKDERWVGLRISWPLKALEL